MLDILVTIMILALLGIGAGTLGSIVGVGGGIIIVPALTFMGLSPSSIASTSLFAVTSTSGSSTLEYKKQRRIDYQLGLKMAVLAIPGSILGAFLSNYISIESFKLLFAILLLSAGIYILFRDSHKRENLHAPPRPRRILLQFGVYSGFFVAGIVSSLFGVGGGIIFVPIMLLVMEMTMFRVAPTSQFIILMSSLSGVLTHTLLGHGDYLYATILAAGAFSGGQIGARISRLAREKVLQQLLALALMGVAVRMVVEWIYALGK